MSRDNSEEVARRLSALLAGQTPAPSSRVVNLRPQAPAPPTPPRSPAPGNGFTMLEHPRCTAELPANIDDLESGRYVGETKEDGDRFHLYCGVTPYPQRASFNNSALLSRVHSKIDRLLCDRSQEYQQISGIDWDAKGLKGSVFDGELMRRSAQLEYVVFDLPFYRGLDMRQIPYTERRKLLVHVVGALGVPIIRPTLQHTSSLFEFFLRTVAAGGEGLIIKDKYGTYGQGWAKMKKCYDVSVIVTGKRPGHGAHRGSTGSLALSVYHEGRLVEIGAIPWREISEAAYDAHMGKIMDVFIQEVHAPSSGNPCGRFRHASFSRWRDDIDATEATFEKLKADLRKQPKYLRVNTSD